MCTCDELSEPREYSILRLSTIGIDVLRMRRIRQRLSFIAEDDQFLLRDQPSLSEKDLNEALEERGM
jgi:LETM1 and EF-hand domain-containing protein 1